MNTLNENKSPGLDGVHSKFLKETSQYIVTPLQIIFNQSLHQCKVPDKWREAKISALFKKGDRSTAENYRPVSLTSIVCKTLEKIVRKHVIDHMVRNDLFTSKQYGFMSGRSTSSQLLNVLDQWTEAIDNGYEIDCIYMDYQKAFDTVPHKRLLSKLRSYGLTAKVIEWISTFLINNHNRCM